MITEKAIEQTHLGLDWNVSNLLLFFDVKLLIIMMIISVNSQMWRRVFPNSHLGPWRKFVMRNVLWLDACFLVTALTCRSPMRGDKVYDTALIRVQHHHC